MFDYSDRIEAFRDEKVRLSADFKEKLLDHRQANRDRLISRLGDHIPGISISDSSFYPQGSFAMQTVIQTRLADEEYDIDEGLVLSRDELVDDDGNELTATQVKEKVRDALKDKRFNRQPKVISNCVRVFYADEDEEKHHVDFPVYRRYYDADDNRIRELAGVDGWVESDPTQVNKWFEDEITDRNKLVDGRGTQLRHLVQLLKRFCRSRPDSEWDLPNGMKLTMLVAECQPYYFRRIDEAFRELLQKLEDRLEDNKKIENLAHPDKPALTRTDNDQNVIDLETRIGEALDQLATLDAADANNPKSARKAWDWIFKSDGFFAEYDEEHEGSKALVQKSESSALSRFAVAWCEPPRWRCLLTELVTVRGRFAISEHSLNWTPFESDCPPLNKYLYLRFTAETNAEPPYTVFWQVVNTGSQAIYAGQHRGEIVQSTSAGAGGLQSTTAKAIFRDERTMYTGMHWVECFIVRNGICIGRSGPFVVNIK